LERGIHAASIFDAASTSYVEAASMPRSGSRVQGAKNGFGEFSSWPFPPGRRNRLGASPFSRLTIRPIQSQVFQRDGGRFSLSSEERAGVERETLFICKLSGAQFDKSHEFGLVHG
jgi:hypothetical protein